MDDEDITYKEKDKLEVSMKYKRKKQDWYS